MTADQHDHPASDPSTQPVVAVETDGVRVEVSTRAQLLAFGDHPASDLPATVVRLRVRGWVPPMPSWTGSMAYLPHLRAVTITTDETGEGGVLTVSIDVALRRPVPAGQVVAAAYPWLYPALAPSRATTPSVAAERGTAAAAAAVLGAPPRRPASEPEGSPLVAEDVLVTAGDVGASVAVETGPAVAVRDLGRPLIDPRVHNPIGRLDPLVDGERATLVRDGERWSAVGPDRVVRLSAAAPLDEQTVRHLRTLESIDLSALRREEPIGWLGTRLAEVAATGVVLHDGPAAAPRGWPSDLVELVSRPYEPVRGLVRERRSLDQRRIALAAFAGPASSTDDRLGEVVRDPCVSALLVSRRPEMAERVVEMLAAQDHPRLEVVAALHGAPPIRTDHLSDRARELLVVNESVPAELSLGEALAHASDRASGELLTKVDDDDHYGVHHVSDLVMARRYSGANLVGRRADHVYLESLDVTIDRSAPSEKYGAPVAGGTMMLSRSDLLSVGGWRPVRRSVDRALHLRVLESGGLVYIASGIGYLYVRHGAGHTWDQGAETFLGASRGQRSGLDRSVLGDP